MQLGSKIWFRRVIANALLISLAFSFWPVPINAEAADYSPQLILSELRQQADVLHALADGNTAKASEFLITRVQNDLLYFLTAIEKNDPSVDKSSMCQAVGDVERKISAYMQAEPRKSAIVKTSLVKLKNWCEKRSAGPN